MTSPVTTSMKLSELLHGVTHTDITRDLVVKGLALDSRKVTNDTLFIALDGEKSHGLKYIESAIENGAAVILVDSLDAISRADVVTVRVENLKQNISKIADNFYSHPSADMNVMGVTGTNGKSTIVSLVAQLENLTGKKSATIGTLGFGLLDEKIKDTGMTTPDAISCQSLLSDLKTKGAEFVAMEVSSHGIDQYRVADIQFNVAVLTNITRDHLDYHGSFEAYAATKASFVEHPNCRIAVINIDDEECEIIAESLRRKGKFIITFSQHSKKADVQASNIKYSMNGFSCVVTSPWGEAEITSSLVGGFNVSNVLAAISVSCALGEDFYVICQHCASISSVAGRMQKVLVQSNDGALLPSIFIDYAHTPDALDNALAALLPHVENDLWVVFGCGGDRDKGKRPLMGEIAERKAQFVVITSDNPRTENAEEILKDIQKGMAKNSSKVISIADRSQAIEYAVNQSGARDCVLIAGKGHENYQILGEKKIDFDDFLVAQRALAAKAAVDMNLGKEDSRGSSCH